MPVELTKELILKGRNYKKKVFVPAYNAEVEIRSLTDLELAECINAVKDKKSAKFIERLMSGEKEITPDMALECVPLLAEIVARGIILYDRSGEQPRELSVEEKKEIIAQMQGMTTVIIAGEILQLTVKPLEDLQDF